MLLKFGEINLSNLSWTYRPHMYLRAKWNKKENNFAHRYKENEAYKRLNNDIIQLYWAPCFTWENTEWNSAVVNTRLKHQFQKICSGMDKLSSIKILSPSSCHPSSSIRALMPVSNPEVQELPRLAAELKRFSACRWPSSSMEAISVEMLCWRASASIPELLVECRDRPGLLSLPGGSKSRSSLM